MFEILLLYMYYFSNIEKYQVENSQRQFKNSHYPSILFIMPFNLKNNTTGQGCWKCPNGSSSGCDSTQCNSSAEQHYTQLLNLS